MRVAVSGGGLVGLTVAAALGRRGHEVVVLERSDAIRAVGAGIGLWDNAMRVLDDIGVGPAIRERGTRVSTWFYAPDGSKVRAAGSGAADHTFDLVPRSALNDMLADAAGRSSIRLDARVRDHVEYDDRVEVRTDNGDTLSVDLLLGADGVYSQVRGSMHLNGGVEQHEGHHAWRAVLPTAAGRAEGTVLTIGGRRTRGGYSRLGPDATMWMINQFDAGDLTGSLRDQAASRAVELTEGGWQDDLLALIDATPEDLIVHNQIMVVSELERWVTGRVALIGDAAHGLSPHVAAGGTLGIEDVAVLVEELERHPDDLRETLGRYESRRRPRFEEVRRHAAAIEAADGAQQFADRYAAFSHWMLTTAP